MSYAWSDIFSVLLVLTDFFLLGSSRLRVYIRLSAVQGVGLGLVLVLTHLDAPPLAFVFLCALGLVTFALKGVVFPVLLSRAMRTADVRREAEPFVGYSASLLLGFAGLLGSVRLASQLPPPGPPFSSLAVPVGIFTVLVGLFLIVSRRKALTQVLGYLVLENGIFALGLSLLAEVSILVELGVLLDIFVAVFVMQIAIYHISHEFDSTDVDRLASLKD